MKSTERFTVAGDEEQQLSPEQAREVLVERARKLAQVYAEQTESVGERVHLIVFSRGTSRYAVALEHLAEIRPLTEWTPVPGVPPYYVGVIHLRGEIVALLDVVTLFGGLGPESMDEKFGVVVSANGLVMALLADTVDDVHDVQPERIHPPLATFTQSRERYISGLVEDGPAIIDVEKLLGDERLWVRHETGE